MTRFTVALSLGLVLCAAVAPAAEPTGFSLGLSSYGVIVDYEQPFDQDQFMGGALMGAYAFNDKVAIDWWGAWRAPSGYQDIIEDMFSVKIDATAASGALAVSYRF